MSNIKLHIYNASLEGYTYHHTSGLSFADKKLAMQGALDGIMALHDTLKLDLEMLSMENKEMNTDKEEKILGLMITSASLPYSFFLESVTIDTDGSYVYDPELPCEIIMEVPKC